MLNETVFCFLFEEFYFRGLLLADDHGVHTQGRKRGGGGGEDVASLNGGREGKGG